ncbi:MAG: hypothetical protein L3J71_10040 [Victivallaceae bacterium]|nr:hypothetical protein [Victivallaceae bacterium]
MSEHHEELAALRAELEDYRKEKEQIRQVIGAIGGAGSSRRDKLFNFIIICVLIAILVLDVLRHFFHIPIPISSMFSLEIGVFLISLKIILMIHKQTKVEHFQFWILNSIEFRINSLAKKLRSIEKKLDK